MQKWSGKTVPRRLRGKQLYFRDLVQVLERRARNATRAQRLKLRKLIMKRHSRCYQAVAADKKRLYERQVQVRVRQREGALLDERDSLLHQVGLARRGVDQELSETPPLFLRAAHLTERRASLIPKSSLPCKLRKLVCATLIIPSASRIPPGPTAAWWPLA